MSAARTARDGAVSLRTFGEVTVAVIDAGLMHWKTGFQEGQDWRTGAVVDDDGRAVIGINGMIAALPGALIAIDPNTLTADDAPAVAEMKCGAPFQAGLDALGVGPHEVTQVLITHGHSDHFTAVLAPRGSNRLFFSNATHYFPAADVPGPEATGSHVGEVRHMIAALEAAGRLVRTTGDVEVTDGVSLLAAPGESPGHQVVRIRSGRQCIYYLGDLVHFPVEVEHPDWCCVASRDLVALEHSRGRVFADPGGAPATFVFTHGRFPGWGLIEPTGPAGWTWRYQ